MSPFSDSLITLAIVLLVARFIKRGSKTLQKFFIPSALLAGVGGLLLGPHVFSILPNEVYSQWSTFPKYLINIVFAGLFLGKTIPSRREVWKMSGPMIAFGNTLAWGQYVLGIGLTMIILTPIFGTNPIAGALIEIGFEGGHGTAAGLSTSFEELGWSQGTDIALGLATISLVTAIISGVIIINWHNRKHGFIIDAKAWKRHERVLIRSGYNLVRFGEKINTNPIKVVLNLLAFALAIAIGVGMLELIQFIENATLSQWTDIRFTSYMPLFPFAMLGGLIVQLILRKTHHQRLIQQRTVQVISTIALDILIVSAIATISISVLKDNLATISLLAVTGVLWALGCLLLLAPRMFPRDPFEQGVTNYGQSMGMTATGLLMNRLADPSNKTHSREGFAYKQLAFEPFMGGGLVTATSAIVIFEFGSMFALIVSSVVLAFWLVVGLLLGQAKRKSHRRRHN